ncbi:maleylacetoacetate isomerase [Sulfitobacter guttiformis]|uniref:Maleylacetoacetate isomerase n=1 Tax=Sulfitobacter guttiformis TaxID=74349 RepID=A0A420DQE8_9RHOB|nr:maleylacetoacetate isomerase [Sulfitobacter guttiformis]KIN73819.1 Maleylacetoacetate isomerase [Sulfitobacter guttiformis KCTC 32187]RKE96452.1 maleylacetoacetate isomerase [Sulfitobacter guttiformis]
MTNIVLWDYPKSSASYRVRIALNLAGIDYRIKTVDLLAREHLGTDHLARNPQGFVPVLDIDGHRLTQSLAILDYLDCTRNLGLLPSEPAERARQSALAHAIAVDLHPICNLSVAGFATKGMEPARTEWMRHFITPRLAAFDEMLGKFSQSPYCCGDTPSLADVVLMPQVYNAIRWGAHYEDFRRIVTVAKACEAHPAFAKAHPDT